MGLEICSPCDTKKQENLGESLNQQGIEQFDFERMQACIEAALMKMPNPVLVYSEFADFQRDVLNTKHIIMVM